MQIRADKDYWLAPLSGKLLLCDCPGFHCHGNVLAAELLEVIAANDGGSCRPPDESVMLQGGTTVGDSRIVAHSELGGIRALSSLSAAIAAAKMAKEPFAWRDEWVSLVRGIRNRGHGLVIELFGRGVASQQFANHGWEVVHSIDVCHTEAFNVFNPVFFAILVGLVLEGRFALLILAPPWRSSRGHQLCANSPFEEEFSAMSHVVESLILAQARLADQ